MVPFRHIFPQATWPVSTCPHLAKAFQLLQAFIKEPSNWANSQCKLQQLESIQAEIDNLMHFLEMEKSYAFTFWEIDYRRIQASMVHFYTFLQLFVKAVIPYPTMTIFQCKSANKLCIQIIRLQKLMNEILTCVNPIAKFLSGPRFLEESTLISNFFENWVFFMKKLPTIKRNKLNHIHNLAKFISLTNPIQICTTRKLQNEDKIRKKSNTVGAQLELKSYPPTSVFQGGPSQYLYTHSSLKRYKRTFSCVQFYINRDIERVEESLKQKRNRIFKIPEKILKNAMEEQMRKKASSLESLTTLQNKIDSLSKNKTVTTNQTVRISRFNAKEQFQNKRLKAHSTIHRRSPTKSKDKDKRPSNNTICLREKSKKRKTAFYEQQCERDSEKMSVRSSKQSTIRRRQLSINTPTIQLVSRRQGNRQEQLDIFYHQKVNLQINEGIVHKSKWDIVRAYVSQRIRLRKINSILKT